MIIDLKHNKIIEATMTEAFARSFYDGLVPKLVSRHGDEISFVQMYEDHIADGFSLGGEFYYPLTLIKNGQALTQWVKWKLSKDEFDERSPYAFLGAALEFELVDKAPEGFEDKLFGKARFAEAGLIKIKVQMMARDITFLSGRYSQTFIDEMARQLTPAIEKAMSVKGIADSSLELCLVFSPESYMEHTSENVTYRRLLITDNSGAPKDFWIKWTRLDGATAYNIAACVNSSNILFEIGEDVSQKVREKEYRFLLAAKGKDKYHNSMGRKNITEWREIIKRLVKRGELVKVEAEILISKETEELTRQLASVVAGSVDSSAGVEVAPDRESDEELLSILEFARETLDKEASIETDASEADNEEDHPEISELEDFYKDEESEQEAPIISFESDDDRESLARAAREALLALDATEVDFGDEDEQTEDEYYEQEDDLEEDDGLSTVVVPEDPCEEEYCEGDYSEIEDEQVLEDEAEESDIEELEALDGEEEPSEEVSSETADEQKALESAATVDVAEIESRIRAELEAKLRLEYEIDARRRAEQEAEKLRVENEKLQAAKKAQDDLRAAEERARAEETERLRAQIEAQLRAEARERERLADAARAAVEEKRRLEEEKERIELMRREEERRAELERQAREEEAKRAAEVERITRETEARIRAEYEAKRAEQAEKLRQPIAEAEEAQPESEPPVSTESEYTEPEKARTTDEEPELNSNYTYISKSVRLLFRKSVDPNIIPRIQEIMKATLDYYGKSNVYLKIKATVPDSQTVILKFLQIPMEEMELLSNIIKVLGNSGLGIARAIVE